MKSMTRRSLLTNVTRGHHEEAPGATAPSTAVRGENGGERDYGATNVVGDVPERPPVTRRLEIGELCAKPRRQAQRHRRGLECSECIQALSAPELLSREWGGDAARLDQRIRAVQERCTALHHALRPTMGFAFVRCNGIAIVRVRYRQSLEGTEHDTLRSEERHEAPLPGHARASCTAHANPRV